VYCVWQVVKIPTIISNNPVYCNNEQEDFPVFGEVMTDSAKCCSITWKLSLPFAVWRFTRPWWQGYRVSSILQLCKAQGIPNKCPVIQGLIKFGEYACQPIIHHPDSNCRWCNRTVIYFALVAIFLAQFHQKRGKKCSYRYFLTYHSPSKSWINQSATAVARIVSRLILIAARCDVRWIHYCKTQQSLNDTLAEVRNHRFLRKIHL